MGLAVYGSDLTAVFHALLKQAVNCYNVLRGDKTGHKVKLCDSASQGEFPQVKFGLSAVIEVFRVEIL